MIDGDHFNQNVPAEAMSLSYLEVARAIFQAGNRTVNDSHFLEHGIVSHAFLSTLKQAKSTLMEFFLCRVDKDGNPNSSAFSVAIR